MQDSDAGSASLRQQKRQRNRNFPPAGEADDGRPDPVDEFALGRRAARDGSVSESKARWPSSADKVRTTVREEDKRSQERKIRGRPRERGCRRLGAQRQLRAGQREDSRSPRGERRAGWSPIGRGCHHRCRGIAAVIGSTSRTTQIARRPPVTPARDASRRPPPRGGRRRQSRAATVDPSGCVRRGGATVRQVELEVISSPPDEVMARCPRSRRGAQQVVMEGSQAMHHRAAASSSTTCAG